MRKFVLVAMIYFHILDDFNLQGIMAEMKQKSWWDKHYPEYMPGTGNGKCKHDYIAPLICHAFMWSVIIHLPVFGWNLLHGIIINDIFLISIIVNAMVHALVDNAKANEKCINLITDQIIHLIQIFFVYITNIY